MIKKILCTVVIICATFLLTLKIKEKKMDKLETKESLIFETGTKGPKEFFTGDVWVNMMISDPKENDLTMYNVTFDPKGRTFWHTHSEGQILLVTHGKGYYQEKGKPAQKLKVGDIVKIPANTNHWHGAEDDVQFIHIGITPKATINKVEWLGAVTDEEYNNK